MRIYADTAEEHTKNREFPLRFSADYETMSLLSGIELRGDGGTNGSL